MDVVIVGAGAAGIGAGLELQARNVPFVILEAADRVGGRAFTDRTSLPGHWDHGCHWLHCADVNPLVPWADRLGSDYDRTGGDRQMRYWRAGGFLNAEATRGVGARLDAGFEAVYSAARAEHDPSVAAALDRGGHTDPFMRFLMLLMACDDLDQVSARGYGDYDDTDVNYPVRSGYGDLVARMATGLPIRLSTPVLGVRDEGRGVRVETASGSLQARAAIVTVSTNVLMSGAMALPERLRDGFLDHVAQVPCGAYEKVVLSLDRLPDGLDDGTGLAVDLGGGGPAPWFQAVGGDHPHLIMHMAGNLARGLAADGASAMTDYALATLTRAFGSGFATGVRATAVTTWGANPYVRGGYSYSRVGGADSRAKMIDADTGPIAFAGEAFSRPWQATAHGAYQSGRDAASRLMAALPGAG